MACGKFAKTCRVSSKEERKKMLLASLKVRVDDISLHVNIGSCMEISGEVFPQPWGVQIPKA